jgi:hypothetical protein
MRSQILAHAMVPEMDDTYRLPWDSMLEAQVRQSTYAGAKDVIFEIGNKVWLSTRHIQTTRPSKQQDYKWTGPYTVSKIINKKAHKVDMPKTMRNHNGFHGLQLDHYTSPVIGQHCWDHIQ